MTKCKQQAHHTEQPLLYTLLLCTCSERHLAMETLALERKPIVDEAQPPMPPLQGCTHMVTSTMALLSLQGGRTYQASLQATKAMQAAWALRAWQVNSGVVRISKMLRHLGHAIPKAISKCHCTSCQQTIQNPACQLLCAHCHITRHLQSASCQGSHPL